MSFPNWDCSENLGWIFKLFQGDQAHIQNKQIISQSDLTWLCLQTTLHLQAKFSSSIQVGCEIVKLFLVSITRKYHQNDERKDLLAPIKREEK